MVNTEKPSIAFAETPKTLESIGKQNRIGGDEKPSGFICPICASREFKEVYRDSENIGFGGRNRIIYCVCSGCSVLFKDPEKFSKK